jgi:hypothetical protein
MSIESKLRTGQFDVDLQTKQLTFLDIRFYADGKGNYFPSVTTILDAYPKGAEFFKWLKENGENADNIRDAAGESGSIVHSLTEAYDRGDIVSLVDADGKIRYKVNEWKMFERYVEFSKEINPEVLMTEYNIISPELGTAGTIDRKINLQIGHKKKKLLLDIKTSNSLHDHYWAQLAAYKKLDELAFPDEPPVDDVCILWLNARTRGASKTGAIQGKGWQLVFPDKSVEHYWKIFQATHLLWNEVNSGLKPNNIVYSIEHQKQ